MTYELHVPRRYNVDVTTHAGNIEVGDVDGRVNLITDGGNITAGRVTGGGIRQPGVPVARLESVGGGHISVRDVTGDLKAMTAGGHITAGNISGDANLSTGGGHIHAGKYSRPGATGNRRRKYFRGARRIARDGFVGRRTN